MRRISFTLLFVALSSIAVCAQERSNPGWKQFLLSDLFLYQYSSNQVRRTPEGTVKILIKMSPTVEGIIDEKARDQIIKVRQAYHQPISGYAQWGYTITEYEVDCPRRKYRILASTDYKQSGKALNSDTSPRDWQDVSPESVAEEILEKACDLR